MIGRPCELQVYVTRFHWDVLFCDLSEPKMVLQEGFINSYIVCAVGNQNLFRYKENISNLHWFYNDRFLLNYIM